MLLVKNLTRRKIDEKFLQKAEKLCLEKAGMKNKTEISLVICGEGKIRSLNKIYRKKDKTTDVLSFGSGKNKFIVTPDETEYPGEIFICHPAAVRQAKRLRHSLKKELARLLIHGILHLAGYNHEKTGKNDAAEAKKMRGLEEAISEKINFYV